MPPHQCSNIIVSRTRLMTRAVHGNKLQDSSFGFAVSF